MGRLEVTSEKVSKRTSSSWLLKGKILRLTDLDVIVDMRSVVEQVLQQVVPVLLLAPLLQTPQDVLEILRQPRAFLSQPGGPAVRSPTRLQDVAVDDDIDHTRDLVLRGEFAGLQGADGLRDLDSLLLGREFGLDLGLRGEVRSDRGGEKGSGFGRHCGCGL